MKKFLCVFLVLAVVGAFGSVAALAEEGDLIASAPIDKSEIVAIGVEPNSENAVLPQPTGSGTEAVTVRDMRDVYANSGAVPDADMPSTMPDMPPADSETVVVCGEERQSGGTSAGSETVVAFGAEKQSGGTSANQKDAIPHTGETDATAIMLAALVVALVSVGVMVVTGIKYGRENGI